MAEIARHELEIVMHGRSGDLHVGVRKRLPSFLELSPEGTIRATSTSYGRTVSTGSTRVSMFRRWRVASGERYAPLNSSPTTAALVNCSAEKGHSLECGRTPCPRSTDAAERLDELIGSLLAADKAGQAGLGPSLSTRPDGHAIHSDQHRHRLAVARDDHGSPLSALGRRSAS